MKRSPWFMMAALIAGLAIVPIGCEQDGDADDDAEVTIEVEDDDGLGEDNPIEETGEFFNDAGEAVAEGGEDVAEGAEEVGEGVQDAVD